MYTEFIPIPFYAWIALVGLCGVSFYLLRNPIDENTFIQDYGKSKAFKSNANLQIAFGIMIYGKADHRINETTSDFTRLMDIIYDDSNHIYILHTDSKSDPLIHNYIDEYCSPKSNCYSIESRSITWAGVSITEMNLALMQAADQFKYPDGSQSSWEYFVLLGHESLPLRSLKYTENVLASYPKGTNFINCWKSSGHDFYGQHEDINWRLLRVVVDTFQNNILIEPDINRIVPKGLEIYKSIQYVILSRQFVQYACYGPETRKILLFLANVKASDELLLATLIQTNKTLALTATCDTTLHYSHWIRPGGTWHPEYLTIEHLPLILNTSELFARKVSGKVSGGSLLVALDRVRADYYDIYPNQNNSSSKNDPSINEIAQTNLLYYIHEKMASFIDVKIEQMIQRIKVMFSTERDVLKHQLNSGIIN
jgi:hypothetical protein